MSENKEWKDWPDDMVRKWVRLKPNLLTDEEMSQMTTIARRHVPEVVPCPCIGRGNEESCCHTCPCGNSVMSGVCYACSGGQKFTTVDKLLSLVRHFHDMYATEVRNRGK